MSILYINNEMNILFIINSYVLAVIKSFKIFLQYMDFSNFFKLNILIRFI